LHVTLATSLFSALEQHVGFRRFINAWIIIIYYYNIFRDLGRDVQDLDFRTPARQESAHFEQTGLDPGYDFIKVSEEGSGFSKFFFWYLTPTQLQKEILHRLKDIM